MWRSTAVPAGSVLLELVVRQHLLDRLLRRVGRERAQHDHAAPTSTTARHQHDQEELGVMIAACIDSEIAEAASWPRAAARVLAFARHDTQHRS